MISCPTFHQGNVLWRDFELAPGVRMGPMGCLVTGLASILHQFLMLDPGQLALKLKQSGGFDREGYLDWNSVERATNGDVALIYRQNTEIHPAKGSCWTMEKTIKTIEKMLSYGQAVGIQVDLVGPDGNPDHFIVCCDRKKDERGIITDLQIMDPAFGDKIWFSQRYGDIWKKIYGLFVIAYPSATFPDWVENKGQGTATYKAAMARVALRQAERELAEKLPDYKLPLHLSTYVPEIFENLISI